MRSRAPRTPRLLVFLLPLTLVLGACGPNLRDQAAIQQVATNIRYGGHTPAPTPRPLVPVVTGSNPFAGFPPFLEPPPHALPGAPAPTPAPACPAAGPLQGVVSSASPTVLGPPAAGTYSYRQTGSSSQTDGTNHTTATPYPATSVRSIKNIMRATNPDGSASYGFDMVETSGTASITTSFQVSDGSSQPAPPLPTAQPSPVPANVSTGMVEITRISQTDASGAETFSPGASNGLELMQIPAAAGENWSSNPTDPSPTNGPQTWETKGYFGAVDAQMNIVPGSERVSVDACGTLLQGWQITLTGMIVAPNTNLTLTATYVIGTEYGGVILESHVVKSGTSQGVKYTSDISDVISQQPLPEGSP